MTTIKQLTIIREIKNVCDQNNIHFWIFGGWGIDALISEITREHDDVDFLIEYSNHNTIMSLIEELNAEITDYKEGGLSFIKDGTKCDLRFFKWIRNGNFIIDLDKNDPLVYPFPKSSISNIPNGILKDMKLTVVTWKFHYIATEGYRYYKNVPLRDKDVSNIKCINEHLTDDDKNDLIKYLPGIKREEAQII